MKRRDRILAATSPKQLCPEAHPTPTCPASKKTLRICRGPLTPSLVDSLRPELRNQVAALSSVYLFPPFFFPFRETIIIQIIVVIYSAIRAARCGCGGPGAATAEPRRGGGRLSPPPSTARWPLFSLRPAPALPGVRRRRPPERTHQPARNLGSECAHVHPGKRVLG